MRESQDYAERVAVLAAQASALSEIILVTQFIKGLFDVQLARTLHIFDPATLEQAEDFASRATVEVYKEAGHSGESYGRQEPQRRQEQQWRQEQAPKSELKPPGPCPHCDKEGQWVGKGL